MIPRALTPAAFAARDPGAVISSFSGETMGTGWSLQAVGASPSVAAGVQAALDRVVALMSQWEPDSDLSRFNRAETGVWCELPAEFAHVVDAALTIQRTSDGAFDPCLGALTDRWGFGASGPVLSAPDTADDGERRIDFDSETRRIRRSAGAILDLSGIAKGYGDNCPTSPPTDRAARFGTAPLTRWAAFRHRPTTAGHR
ncbi:MAG: FAD:protein FMN transferase, partial [Alphaproteobacteria bacterium]|nr:FAD:protein FMN transferase [Alphaproteobacteria bacterium]